MSQPASLKRQHDVDEAASKSSRSRLCRTSGSTDAMEGPARTPKGWVADDRVVRVELCLRVSTG